MAEEHTIAGPAKGEPLPVGRVGVRLRIPLSGGPSRRWSRDLSARLTVNSPGIRASAISSSTRSSKVMRSCSTVSSPQRRTRSPARWSVQSMRPIEPARTRRTTPFRSSPEKRPTPSRARSPNTSVSATQAFRRARSTPEPLRCASRAARSLAPESPWPWRPGTNTGVPRGTPTISTARVGTLRPALTPTKVRFVNQELTNLTFVRITLLGNCAEIDDAEIPTPRRSAGCSARGTRSVRGVEFSRELRDDVLAGDITLSVRLWKRPQVREGGRYRVGPGLIEVDAIELVPFAAITEADVRRAGEPDRETLRDRAAHAGPIDEDTLVYRIEVHAVSLEDELGVRTSGGRVGRRALRLAPWSGSR